MCTPALAIAAVAVSGGVQMAGQYQAGMSQAAMYSYQKNAAQQQKQLMQRQADSNITFAQDAAARNSNILAKRNAEVVGAQKAQIGAQGLGSSVTAGDIARDTFTKQELDQEALQYNANVKAWNITNELNNNLWQKDVEIGQLTNARKNTLKSTYIQMGTTLLSTAASTAMIGMYGATKTPGMSPTDIENYVGRY